MKENVFTELVNQYGTKLGFAQRLVSWLIENRNEFPLYGTGTVSFSVDGLMVLEKVTFWGVDVKVPVFMAICTGRRPVGSRVEFRLTGIGADLLRIVFGMGEQIAKYNTFPVITDLVDAEDVN